MAHFRPTGPSDSTYELIDVDLGSKQWHVVAVDAAAPAWSPDGRRLAYSTSGGAGIIETIATGQRMVLPSQDAIVSMISWAPDSRHVVCGQWGSGFPKDGLWTYDVDSTGKAQVLGGAYSSPSWSSDSAYVAFVSQDWPSAYHIGRIRLSTGVVDTLTHGSTDDRDPSWSGATSRIYWTRYHAGSPTPQLWSMGLSGADQRLVLSNALSPACSPQGTKLSCIAYDPQRSFFRAAIAALDGTQLTWVLPDSLYPPDGTP